MKNTKSMICNKLKDKLPEGWREKFVHRDCDQANYEFAMFEIDGENKILVRNPDTDDIMEYYYDDFDGEWIEVNKKVMRSLINKDIESKVYISPDGKYIKHIGRKKRELSSKLVDRCPYPIISICSCQVKTHRLIAFIFIPNPYPEKYNIVNHKDLSRTNFSKENLEWCDAKWNAKRENQKKYILGTVYERLSDGRRFSSADLAEEYKNKQSSSAVLGAISRGKTYHGSTWKVIDLSLEDYLSRHPLTDNWIQHPTLKDVYVNSCGVLRIKDKVVVGNKHECLYYSISIGGKLYKTHRIIMEAVLNRELLNTEVVDHIIPVSKDDINNEISNLRVGTQKDNLNNEHTRIKWIKKGSLKKFSLFGDFIEKYKTVDDALKANSEIKSKVLLIRATELGTGALISAGNFLWCFEGEEDRVKDRLDFIYYKTPVNSLTIKPESASINLKELSKEIPINKLNKVLNTGFPLDGYVYQRGKPDDILIDKSNVTLEKKRDNISWREFTGRNKNREDN